METAIQKTDIQALQDEAIRVLHRVSAVMDLVDVGSRHTSTAFHHLGRSHTHRT